MSSWFKSTGMFTYITTPLSVFQCRTDLHCQSKCFLLWIDKCSEIQLFLLFKSLYIIKSDESCPSLKTKAKPFSFWIIECHSSRSLLLQSPCTVFIDSFATHSIFAYRNSTSFFYSWSSIEPSCCSGAIPKAVILEVLFKPSQCHGSLRGFQIPFCKNTCNKVWDAYVKPASLRMKTILSVWFGWWSIMSYSRHFLKTYLNILFNFSSHASLRDFKYWLISLTK